jgi:putative FmdB family regulatory protein
MPIYEYRCQECGKRSQRLILNPRAADAPACAHCRSPKLERLFSRFASPKSEEARLEALTDPSRYGDFDENDPHSMERLMKKVGEDMGEELPDDLTETGAATETEDASAGADSDPAF